LNLTTSTQSILSLAYAQTDHLPPAIMFLNHFRYNQTIVWLKLTATHK